MMILLAGGSSPEVGQPPTGDDDPGEICIANIGPRERRKRLLGGVVAFVAGLVVLAALLLLGWDRPWRLALLPLFWGAALGFFQWREKT
jgi:hypothetical protein